MAVDGRLNFDTKIDTGGFNNDTKAINKSLGSLKSALGKIAIAASAAFSAKKLIDFGKQSIETASNMAEVQNVVDTAFGSMSDKMENFADSSVKQFGISRLSAKQTGSTFMAMAAGMGLAQENASDMAVSLTGLSADMASFYNVGQDVASTALKSVFTGETETLKQFGIVMTDANLQAYALSQGISKSTSEMSQAEKVQLRYGYVMQQTSLAQGDFAKTSDSWANQTRILSEQWKEFGSVIGSVLMNALLPAVKAVNNALSQLISWAQSAAQAIADAFDFALQSAESSVAGLLNDSADLEDSSSQTADNYSSIADSAQETEESQENQLASFDKVNKLGGSSSDTDNSGTAALNSLAGSAAAVKLDVETKEAEKKLSHLLKDVKKAFKSAGEYIKKNFGGIFTGIWDGLISECAELTRTFSGIFRDLKTLAEPLKQYFTGDFTVWMQTVFSTLGNIATGTFDTFNTVFSDIWNIAVFPILEKFVTEGLPMLTQFSTQAWETTGTAFSAVKEIFDTLWSEAYAPVLGFITQAWCDMVDTIAAFWDEWGTPIFEGIREAINSTKDVFLNVWETVLRPVFDSIMETVDRVWTEHLQPLAAEFLDFVGELITGATDIYNKFITPIVSWLVDTLGPVVAKVFNKIVRSVGDTISSIIDAVKGVITALKGVVQFVSGVFTGDWKKAWQGIKTIFKGIWDAFVSIVKIPINKIIDIINGLTGAIESALNWVIDGINSISIDLPDAVADVVGFDSLGFNLSNVNIPDIPKLATGTVVPANYGEFLAVLGDNKRETEIVSPLSTMKQAVLEALVAYGGTGGNGQKISVTIPITLNGRIISQIVIDDINEFIRRNGRSPIKA